jgi:hypothetical protein
MARRLLIARGLMKRHRALQSGVERTRRYRARQRAGLVMVSLAIEPTAVSEWLVDYGFLEEWDVQDHDRVQLALQEAVAFFSQA